MNPLPRYRLERSRRKTLSLQVTREGEVVVRAPLRLPLQEIDAFLAGKGDWLAAALGEAERRSALRQAFTLEEGSLLTLLGREYPVTLLPDGGSPAFTGQSILLPGSDPQLRAAAARQLYAQLARQQLPPRVARLAPLVGVQPAGVRITGAATRWGSCSGKNRLCFSWRLLVADPHCVDYVVVHELCHILQHNHSPLFWQQVQRVLPGYAPLRARLKEYGHLLSCQGWADQPPR